MDLKEYQEEAKKTDQLPEPSEHAVLVPLLGLVGEAGTLVSEYKKLLRDGSAHERFRDRVSEELGDILWYLANVASKFGLDLGEIAKRNLWKTRDRWPLVPQEQIEAAGLFDETYPIFEQLPREFSVRIEETRIGVDGAQVVLTREGRQIADRITDNAYRDDGYRFHDVFHFAFAAILGWSPTVRAFFKCKRKSNPTVDEVEDGGRAIVIEEGLIAFVFDYARQHRFLEAVESLDSELLRTMRSVTSQLEVSKRTTGDWERAVLEGFRVWRLVRANRGGYVSADLRTKRVFYRERDWLTPSSENRNAQG